MTSKAPEGAGIPQGAAQALGRAMHAQRATTAAKSAASHGKTDSSNVSIVQAVWQHPFVDVFKHFKLQPTSDWK